MYEGKEKSGKDERVERYLNGFCNETWLLQLWCPLVKVMDTVLMHGGWGKPPKHKVQSVHVCLGLVTMPRYLPHLGELPVLWGKASEMSQGALGVFDGLWPFLASHTNLVEPIIPHQRGWTPSGPFPGVAGGVLQLREDNCDDKKHLPTLQDLPHLSQSLACSPWWWVLTPLVLWGTEASPPHTQKLIPCPSGG